MDSVPLRSCVIAGYHVSDLPPVKALLEKYGCQAHVVATASEAWRVCQTQKIDLVISRIVFAEEGRMNGVDLAHDLSGCVPVILTTEFSDAILNNIRASRREACQFCGRPWIWTRWNARSEKRLAMPKERGRREGAKEVG